MPEAGAVPGAIIAIQSFSDFLGFNPHLLSPMIVADYLFLNFLLNPARPINPEPKRSMVVGSGTGA